MSRGSSKRLVFLYLRAPILKDKIHCRAATINLFYFARDASTVGCCAGFSKCVRTPVLMTYILQSVQKYHRVNKHIM